MKTPPNMIRSFKSRFKHCMSTFKVKLKSNQIKVDLIQIKFCHVKSAMAPGGATVASEPPATAAARMKEYVSALFPVVAPLPRPRSSPARCPPFPILGF